MQIKENPLGLAFLVENWRALLEPLVLELHHLKSFLSNIESFSLSPDTFYTSDTQLLSPENKSEYDFFIIVIFNWDKNFLL